MRTTKTLNTNRKVRFLQKTVILTLILSVFYGCKMGPNYSRGPMPEHNSYRLEFPTTESIADLGWWDVFSDPVLQDMIRATLDQNRDLRLSLARIDEALAITGVVRADLYPRLGYGADGKGQLATGGAGLTGDGSAALRASWQIDLWGRFKRLNEAALQEYLATEEAYRATTISLVAAVADTYLLLRDLDNRLEISIATEITWQENLDIVTDKFNAGIISEVDVKQAVILVEEAKSTIQLTRRLIGQTENALSTLMGLPPGDITRGIAMRDQSLPPDVPVGLPSELLSRRPDVLQAERRLMAQTERIGAAEALKYPQLTITADLGASFANPAIGFTSLGSQLLGPILNSGAIQKGVEIEIARTEQLLNAYEQTYLTALREVEDAMIAVETYDLEYQSRFNQLQAANDALEISWIRYNGGLTSYLEVLDLQRSLFTAQLKASEALQNRLTSTVGLYQVLGGGWQLPGDASGDDD